MKRLDDITQDHRAIPWWRNRNKAYRHYDSDLVQQPGLTQQDLQRLARNVRPLLGQSGKHSPSYHAKIAGRLREAFPEVAEKGQAAAQAKLDEVIERIWADIASGDLRPYDHKDVVL